MAVELGGVLFGDVAAGLVPAGPADDEEAALDAIGTARVLSPGHFRTHTTEGEELTVRAPAGAREAAAFRLAESTRPRLLFETQLPVRSYLPREDVRLDLLLPSTSRTACAYKGETSSYWAVDRADGRPSGSTWCSTASAGRDPRRPGRCPSRRRSPSVRGVLAISRLTSTAPVRTMRLS